MNNTEAFIDRLEAKIDNLKAENTKLRADLASATEKANHLPGLTANLDELHWAMNLVRDRLDQDANAELSTEQRTAFRVIIEDIPRRSWPPTGQDIEQARLEREVARAAVAHAHARAAVDRHPPGSRNEECEATVIAYSRSAEAKLALIDYINAKREGGTK